MLLVVVPSVYLRYLCLRKLKYTWRMPRSKVHLKPLLCAYSISLFTILKAMSSYGGPAMKRIRQVSPVGDDGSGSMRYAGARLRSIRSG